MPHHAHAHHQHAQSNYRVRNVQPVVEGAETIVNVVYVTAAPTFDGPIGGYKTMDGSSRVQTSSEQTPIAAAPAPAEPSSSPVKAAPAVLAQSSPDTIRSPSPATQVVPTSPAESHPTQQTVDQPPNTTPAETTHAKATSSTSTSTSSAVALPSHETKHTEQSSHKILSETLVPTTSTGLSSSQSETPTVATPVNAQSVTSSVPAVPAVSTPSSGGMSGGAKAGLAIGILLAIAALAGLIFFGFWRRRNHRNEAYGRAYDEKAGLGDGGAAAGLGRSASVQTSTTSATAPRLSLRPVTQFLPDIAAQRKSGNNLVAAGGQFRYDTPIANDADREKALINNRTSDPANPFGSHAEMSAKLPVQSNPENVANPFGNHAETGRQLTQVSAEPAVVPPAPLRIRTPTPDGKTATAGAGIAAVGATSTMAARKPKPLNHSPNRAASPAMNGVPSPTASDFSMTPVSPRSFANGPPPSNVHRIQLDFKPSMDDELELRAGQLVRLLHEYDDGWVSWVIQAVAV